METRDGKQIHGVCEYNNVDVFYILRAHEMLSGLLRVSKVIVNCDRTLSFGDRIICFGD